MGDTESLSDDSSLSKLACCTFRMCGLACPNNTFWLYMELLTYYSVWSFLDGFSSIAANPVFFVIATFQESINSHQFNNIFSGFAVPIGSHFLHSLSKFFYWLFYILLYILKLLPDWLWKIFTTKPLEHFSIISLKSFCTDWGRVLKSFNAFPLKHRRQLSSFWTSVHSKRKAVCVNCRLYDFQSPLPS